MSNMTIRVTEDSTALRVYLNGSGDPDQIRLHDEEFPILSEDGFEDIEECEAPDYDRVTIEFPPGCPDGYAIVVFWKGSRPVLCLVYGPDGFFASYGTLAAAVNAAAVAAKPKPSAGYRP